MKHDRHMMTVKDPCAPCKSVTITHTLPENKSYLHIPIIITIPFIYTITVMPYVYCILNAHYISFFLPERMKKLGIRIRLNLLCAVNLDISLLSTRFLTCQKMYI